MTHGIPLQFGPGREAIMPSNGLFDRIRAIRDARSSTDIDALWQIERRACSRARGCVKIHERNVVENDHREISRVIEQHLERLRFHERVYGVRVTDGLVVTGRTQLSSGMQTAPNYAVTGWSTETLAPPIQMNRKTREEITRQLRGEPTPPPSRVIVPGVQYAQGMARPYHCGRSAGEFPGYRKRLVIA